MKARLPAVLLLSLAPFGTAFADACAGVAHCFDAGPFAAEVTSINPTWNNTHKQHFLRLNFKVRNTGTQPLTLGFPWRSAASITDNYGNAYAIDWKFPQNISGIGIVGNGQANASFTVAPGESRTGSLVFNRWPGNTPVGNTFTADFTIEELKPIPGQQRLNVGGQFSLNFTALTGGLLGATPGDAVSQGVDSLFKAFTKKK